MKTKSQTELIKGKLLIKELLHEAEDWGVRAIK